MCDILLSLDPSWVQAIASLSGVVALFFLWGTFRSQQKLTSLELKKFKDSNKPFIELVSKSVVPNHAKKEYILHLELCLKENFLTNFSYKSFLPDCYLLVCDLNQKNSVVPVGTKINFRIEVDMKNHSENSIDYELSDSLGEELILKSTIGFFILSFENKFKDKYTQKIVIDKGLNMYLEPMVDS